MATQVVVMVPRTQLTTSDATYYTSTGGKTMIDKATVTNTSASPVTFDANIVESGGSAAAANQVVKSKTIAANETYSCPELVGQVLDTGETLSAKAGANTSLTFSVSGRLIT